jgi:hypothetical protein
MTLSIKKVQDFFWLSVTKNDDITEKGQHIPH